VKRLALFLLFCTSLVSAQTYVHSANCTTFPCAITSTGTGNNIYVITDYQTTQPTSLADNASGGSNTYTKQGTCSPSGGASAVSTVCVWLVLSSKSLATSITATGGTSVNAIWEFEASGMNTSSPADQVGTCTGSTSCAASLTPSTANEFIVAAYSCAGSGTAITGSPTTFSHVTTPNGEVGGNTIVSSTATETATSDTSCGNSTTGGVVGAIWSFEAAGGGGSTPTSNKRAKLKKILTP
jgi:hypothetical protein